MWFAIKLCFLILGFTGIANSAEWQIQFGVYSVAVSNDLIMKCKVQGEFLGFFRNVNETIKESSKFKITEQTEGSSVQKILDIISASEADYGEYICKDSVSEAKVQLVIAVEFGTIQPKQSLAIGSPGRIDALVYGRPRPDISWYKDGNKLATLSNSGNLNAENNRYEIEKQGSLKVKNIQEGDAGNYEIEYVSSAGQRKRETLTIDVGNKPEIQAMLQPTYTKTKGQQLTMKCSWKYTDDKPIWKFTNELGSVSEIDQSKVDMDGYTIKNISDKDVGNYSCESKNQYGFASVHTRILSVITPAEITSTFNGTNVPIGTEYNLICEAKGQPLPDVKILHENVLVTGSSEGLANLSFVMSKERAGSYKCIAGNGALSEIGESLDVDKSMVIVMTTPPSIDRSAIPSKIVTAIAYNFSFTCKASGNPIPTLVISQNGQAVNATIEKMGKMITASYKVDKVVADDIHDLLCKAENELGEDSATVDMVQIVRAPPPFGLKQTGSAGLRYIDLQWESQTTADSYIVYINDTRQEATDETKLYIGDLDQNTYYNFRVASVNIAGIGNSSDPVVLVTSDIIPPGKVQNVMVVDITSESADITWDAPENVDPQIKDDPGLDISYVLRYCKLNNVTEEDCVKRKMKDSFETLENLVGGTKYRVTIFGVNQRVPGEAISKDFRTKENVSPSPPAPSGKSDGLGAGVIAAIIIVIIIIILIVVDLFCCFFNQCGFTHCCVETLCPPKQNKYIPTDTKEADEKQELKSKMNEESAENVV